MIQTNWTLAPRPTWKRRVRWGGCNLALSHTQFSSKQVWKNIYICNENATKKFKFHKNVFTLGYGAKVLIRTRIILINDNIAGPAACTSRMLVCISRYIATATAYCCHKTIINKNVITSMTWIIYCVWILQLEAEFLHFLWTLSKAKADGNTDFLKHPQPTFLPVNLLSSHSISYFYSWSFSLTIKSSQTFVVLTWLLEVFHYPKIYRYCTVQLLYLISEAAVWKILEVQYVRHLLYQIMKWICGVIRD